MCECVCVCVSVCMSGYPTVPGLMAARLASLDDEFLSSFPLDGHWVAGLQDSIGELTHNAHSLMDHNTFLCLLYRNIC